MKIYLASRYSRKEELKKHRQQLEQLGHKVISSWLDTEKRVSVTEFDSSHTELANAQSAKYFNELMFCDLCILFTEEPRRYSSRGGRFVEFGIAMGAGKRLFVVGPVENIFCMNEAVDRQVRRGLPVTRFDKFRDVVRHFGYSNVSVARHMNKGEST